jgi:hypothetical protein
VPEEEPRCPFCGLRKSAVRKLLQGGGKLPALRGRDPLVIRREAVDLPFVYICNECTVFAAQVCGEDAGPSNRHIKQRVPRPRSLAKRDGRWSLYRREVPPGDAPDRQAKLAVHSSGRLSTTAGARLWNRSTISPRERLRFDVRRFRRWACSDRVEDWLSTRAVRDGFAGDARLAWGIVAWG